MTLVLFDIDDTLIDHSSAVAAGVSTLYAAIHPVVPQPIFLATWHEAMRQQFPRYLSGELTYQDQRRARVRTTVSIELTDVQTDELFADYKRAYEAHWALFSDVVSCRDAGVAWRDAVYIGDAYETDALGARRAGLHGVWLDRTQSRRADHESRVICGLGELADLLRATAV
jgi:FMN phosphatase YigB (HAD superfamily)